MEFQLSSFKSWKMMLWKCCSQYASYRFRPLAKVRWNLWAGRWSLGRASLSHQTCSFEKGGVEVDLLSCEAFRDILIRKIRDRNTRTSHRYIYIYMCLYRHIHTFLFPRWLSSKVSAYRVWDVGAIPGREVPWGKEMATHSSILAWEIPWTEEPGRLQFMGSQRIGHDLVTIQQQTHISVL